MGLWESRGKSGDGDVVGEQIEFLNSVKRFRLWCKLTQLACYFK